MKKIFILLVCVCISILIVSCSNETDTLAPKYDDAKSYLDSGNYNAALGILDELVSNNYKDSVELLKEAK